MGNLFEGGVAGHMSHLYDNPDLTFSKMKEILEAASSGNLEGTEKTDGQNIFLSYSVIDNHAVAARGKGDIQRGGMTKEELATKFEGRGELSVAFNDAFAAFETIVQQIPEEERDDIFGPNVEVYYNAEIQDPRNPNVINYDVKTLTIHRVGHAEYDKETGNPTDRDVSDEANRLAMALAKYQKERVKNEYVVQMNATRQLEKLDDDVALHKALSEIDAVIRTMGIDESQTVGEYVMKFAEEKVLERMPMEESQLSLVMDELRKRMYGLKGKHIKGVKAAFPKEAHADLNQLLTVDSKQIYKEAILPLESAIHDFAVEMMKGLQSAFILDNVKEVSRLRFEIGQAIEAIESSGSEEAMEILKQQMRKLKSVENVTTAAEGFVFDYDGHSYKFTGNFAPMNQLLGLFKYGRGKLPPMSWDRESGLEGVVDGFEDIGTPRGLEENLQDDSGESRPKSIALIPGAYKPPHLGHLAMVQHYAELADEVQVWISNPKSPKSQRLVGKTAITADMSYALWQNFVSGMPNVKIKKSNFPSPFSVLFYKTSPKTSDLPPGTEIYFGASDKIDPKTRKPDAERFESVSKRAWDKLIIKDRVEFAAPTKPLPNNYLIALSGSGYLKKLPSWGSGKDAQNYHASDLRFLLEEACHSEDAKMLAGYYVRPENVDIFLTTCKVIPEDRPVKITESELQYMIYEEIGNIILERYGGGTVAKDQLSEGEEDWVKKYKDITIDPGSQRPVPASKRTPMGALKEMATMLEDIPYLETMPEEEREDRALDMLKQILEVLEGAFLPG